MKIISWNINSLRLRLPLLRKLVKHSNPDIICLQETKVTNQDFPYLELKELGFDFIEFDGEKSYNGVAIISKIPLTKVNKIDVLSYGHKRHIAATISTKSGEVTIHNFYVPAGGDIPDPKTNEKFDHKLKFVDWMTDFFSEERSGTMGVQSSPYLGGSSSREAKRSGTMGVQSSPEKIIILGDMNIAPLEHDVWSHKQLLKVVSHTPIEVEKLLNLQRSLDFVDSHRLFTDHKEKLYSWWSYRAADPFKSDRGRRLDHIWTTPNLEPHILEAKIYREFRVAEQPSDHVPIQTTFNLL